MDEWRTWLSWSTRPAAESLTMGQRVVLALLVLVAGVKCRSGQPNVLLIIVDDLRPALGCYGDTLAFTPHVDALATHGTVFTRAYAQQALCGPSRTSFLTSRRPDTTRLYDVHSYWRRHAGNFTTLPQYFKEHGYHTTAAGKVFHPGIVSNHSDDQPYSWSETPYHPPTQAHKQDPVCLGADGSLHTNIYCPVKVSDQPGGSLPDIETTRHSTAWLEEWAERDERATNGPSQPFFFAVGYHKPHIPLKFPREFLELFPIDTVPLAPNRWLPKGLPSVAWNPWNDLRSREDIAALNVSFPYGPMPDYYARYIRQGYYAAMSYTDSLIGDLLATVDRLFPDTIVAFIGDHGWSLGEHQEWSKFSNFEVATRVPFIIRNWRRAEANVSLSTPHAQTTPHTPPRRRTKRSSARPGVEYSGLVELVDLFPTLVDLAGLPALEQCPSDSHKVQVCTEGFSLSQIVNTNQQEIEREAENKKHGKDRESFDASNVESNAILSQNTNFDHTMKNRLMPPKERNRNIKTKTAAFSQYPRPGPIPSKNPDSDQPHTSDTTIMGYSVRTDRFRFTAWLRFDNITYQPDWDHIVAEELYDHKIDPSEDRNLVGKGSYARKRKALFGVLRGGWRSAVRWR